MNTPAAGDEPPKIIIDEDWKSQAQAEKERLERARAESPELRSDDLRSDDLRGDDLRGDKQRTEKPAGAAPQKPPPQARPRGPLPAPSLAMLATSIATQAMVALGVAFDPGHPEGVEPDFAQARHLIDTLQLLQDKTAGNRTPEEDAVLSNLLHEARMTFVALQAGPPPPRGDEPTEFGISA